MKFESGEFQIKLDICMDVFLLMQMNFCPYDHKKLIYEIIYNNKSVREIDDIGMYDEKNGYAIYLLYNEFSPDTLREEIYEMLMLYFDAIGIN